MFIHIMYIKIMAVPFFGGGAFSLLPSPLPPSVDILIQNWLVTLRTPYRLYVGT